MRFLTTPKYIINKLNPTESDINLCTEIQNLYLKISNDFPEVSIVIPAFNEEKNILKTLTTLVNNKSNYTVEIIVVNNNSTDKTEELVKASGILCVNEKKQGITAARNAGLKAAKGKYILNADADTLYPVQWINEMIRPLNENQMYSLVYGNFSFIPTTGVPRWVYFFYEYFADVLRWFNKKFREEAVNVYGFNSGFRKVQGIAVNGFEHPPGTNEDGWLAVKLRENNYGALCHVTNKNALVWTTDRRIQMDGGIFIGSIKRILRFLGVSTQKRNDL